MFNATPYLTNDAVTLRAYTQLIDDAWEQNWSVGELRDAMFFVQQYPVVACAEQYKELLNSERSKALTILQRAIRTHYTQRLQDFFDTKESFSV